MNDMAQIIRDSGLLEELLPADEAKHMQGLKKIADPSGKFNPKAIQSLRLLEEIGWEPSSLKRIRVPYGGTTVLLGAHATTPPTTGGGAVIRVTYETLTTGATAIVPDLTLPVGARINVINIAHTFATGTWFHASVVTPNGASGVSISLAIRAE